MQSQRLATDFTDDTDLHGWGKSMRRTFDFAQASLYHTDYYDCTFTPFQKAMRSFIWIAAA
ncbi:MAG: hypothetical protein JWO20_2638 [Candidatus Angelobacter sp.]|jgi:hypothetical protein|nr:hypothetical protein [Candidatus Angelobacter sp.]